MATANHRLTMTEEPLTPNTDDIGARARTAVGWRALSQFSSQGISIVTGIILARLLMPADFGIIGMAGIVTGLAGVFRDLGFGQALVQRAELRPEHSRSAFWMTLIMGGLLYAALYFGAPFAGGYFHDERMVPVLRLMALSFLISPFGMVPRSLLQRELDFRRPFYAGLAGTITSGAVGITLALLGHGYWSLVWALLASSAVGTIALCIVTRYTPPLRFDLSGVRDLASFGLGLTGTGIVNYIATRVDYIVIGRRLDATALGLYTRAYSLMDYLSGLAFSSVGPVLFPAFSAMQTQNERLRSAYLRALTLISMLGFPVLALLVISAPELIPLVYGAQWEGAVLPTQVLGLMGAVFVMSHPGDPLLKGTGHVHALLALITERAVVVVAGALAGSAFGVVGVAWGVAIATCVHFVIHLLVIRYCTGIGFQDHGRALASSMLVGVVVAGVAVGARFLAAQTVQREWLTLGATVVMGLVALTGLAWWAPTSDLRQSRSEVTLLVRRALVRA